MIGRKNTLVAKRLWPALRDIGIGRDPWQTNRLDDEAIALLDDINDATAPYWSTNHGRKSRPCWSAGCWSIRLRYTPPPAITGRPTKDGNDGVMSGISAKPSPLRRHGRPSRPSLRNRPTSPPRSSFRGKDYLTKSSSRTLRRYEIVRHNSRHGGKSDVMHDSEVLRISKDLNEGKTIDPNDVRALVDKVAALRKAAQLPDEILVRVHRGGESDPLAWRAEHPLLSRHQTCRHPADALVHAAIELRRVLDSHDWPERKRFDGQGVDAEEAEVLANTDESDIGQALRWALDTLRITTAENHKLRYGHDLLDRFERQEPGAVDERRALAVAGLLQRGVQNVATQWGDDGFGSASEVALSLPSLLLASKVSSRQARLEPDELEGPQFSPKRSWHALSHRYIPRPMSEYVTAIVTPLRVAPAVELALRKLGELAPEGRDVATFAKYRELLTMLLPDVSADHNTDTLSPGWCPFDLGALGPLLRGGPDEGLDVNGLAVANDHPRHFLSIGARWHLAWATDAAEHRSW
jgi:hypothetical protein